MDNPSGDPTRSDSVKQFWNERHKEPDLEAHDNYLNHPLIQAYISMRAFANVVPHMDVAVHAVRGRTNPGDRVLSLGCGLAGKEQVMAQALPDREFLAVDIADEIVAAAREEVARKGIRNLEVVNGDFNALDLTPNSLQVLVGLGAIHHVENLEGLWAAATSALVPGGSVMSQEYVGPNRFQWTDAQLAACNDAMEVLIPDEHKVHHRSVTRVPLEEIIAADPSEAVRSAEILATCEDAGFTIEAYNSGGGALLQPCLMYQIHTFEPQNWQHNLILAQLFDREERHMAAGELGDDFAMFVATPPA